jgi:hypothetical protein
MFVRGQNSERHAEKTDRLADRLRHSVCNPLQNPERLFRDYQTDCAVGLALKKHTLF